MTRTSENSSTKRSLGDRLLRRAGRASKALQAKSVSHSSPAVELHPLERYGRRAAEIYKDVADEEICLGFCKIYCSMKRAHRIGDVTDVCRLFMVQLDAATNFAINRCFLGIDITRRCDLKEFVRDRTGYKPMNYDLDRLARWNGLHMTPKEYENSQKTSIQQGLSLEMRIWLSVAVLHKELEEPIPISYQNTIRALIETRNSASHQPITDKTISDSVQKKMGEKYWVAQEALLYSGAYTKPLSQIIHLATKSRADKPLLLGSPFDGKSPRKLAVSYKEMSKPTSSRQHRKPKPASTSIGDLMPADWRRAVHVRQA